MKALSDVAPWRLAVVLEVNRPVGAHRLAAGREPGGARLARSAQIGIVPLEGVKWAKAAHRPATASGDHEGRRRCSNPGDVIYVEPAEQGCRHSYRLRQVPEISGAMVVMDPWTGRVLAMVGGFSYDQSQFNRATQALRQPGSSFKPIVYSAALDNGYTPSTVVLDAPIEIDQGPGAASWRPENYDGKFYGPQTLRFGIETVAQRDDGAARAGHRHAADRRIRQALRRLRQPAALSVVSRSAPARRR